jgi:O-antigen ligase
LRNRDRAYRSIIEFGIIGLLVFSPLPSASVPEWAVLVIQLTALVLMIFYLMMEEKPIQNARLRKSLKWPGYLFVGLWFFILLQIVPLPKIMVKILSPETYAFRQLYSPDFSSLRFMSLSLLPSHSLRAALALISYFMVGFLVVKTIDRRAQSIRIIYVLYFMGVFEAFYGLINLYRLFPGFAGGQRIPGMHFVSGTFVNRNHFAGYLEMVIPLSLGLVLTRIDSLSFTGLKWKEKIARLSEKNTALTLLLSLGIILMALALIFTRSRTAIILLVFIFAFFLIYAVSRRERKGEYNKGVKIFLVSIFIIVLILSFYIGMDRTFKRLALTRLLQESRPDIWADTLAIFSGFPLFGSGLGTYAALSPLREGDGELVKVSHAHNDYLEYLTELGVVGTGLLLGGVALLFIRCVRHWRRRKSVVARGLGLGGIVAVSAISIHSLTDFNLQIPSNMLLFSVVLSLTLVSVTHKAKKRTAG